MNLPFMGLRLTAPTTVESASSGCNGETYPLWSATTYQFPARGELSAVKLVWYDGMKGRTQNHPPKEGTGSLNIPQGSSGAILIGDKGGLFSLHDYAASWQVLDQGFHKHDVKKAEANMPP